MRLRDKIARRMVELVVDETSPWERVPSRYGDTIRRTWVRETPDHHRVDWSGPTYDAYVFLTLVAGKFILGTSAAPWVGRRDQVVPLWLAEAILDDPELALDSHRQNEMRHARLRRGQSGRSGDGVGHSEAGRA